MRTYRYRVMTKDLTSYKMTGDNIEHLQEYCRGDDVIVSMRAKRHGIKIRICFFSFDKIIRYDKYSGMFNIFKFHVGFNFEYHDETDKIVWTNK